jgi:hypothetical protein
MAHDLEMSNMDPNEEWLKAMYDAIKCIPGIVADEDEAQPPQPVDIFSDKPIKRFQGGPPPRGKPKDAATSEPIGGEAAIAIHHAISKR